MAANSPRRDDSDGDRLPLDERLGQYVLDQPLVRSAREQPEVAAPWIVLGVAAAIAGLIGGMPAVLLVLLVGLPALLGARLLASKRRDRPSRSATGNPMRSLLLMAVLTGFVALVVVLLAVDAGGDDIAIVGLVLLVVVLPVAGKAFLAVWRRT